MKIKLIYFDKFKDLESKKLFENYKKRIENFISFEIKELKEISNSVESVSNVKLSLQKEAKLIQQEIKPTSLLILLDINGDSLDSKDFANFLNFNINQSNKKELIFLIGSSHGFDESIKKISNYRISFSKMTFCKNLFKIIFVEQLYRAFTIINNINYHK